MEQGSRGFTLIECVVTLAVGLILLLCVLSVVGQSAAVAGALCAHIERDRESVQAASLLGRWVPPAGNGLTGAGLAVTGSSISVGADIDGEGGFPDGDLDESFEDIAVRAGGGGLQIRSGGGNFQPFVLDVGWMAAEEAGTRLGLELGMQAKSGRGGEAAQVRTVRLDYHLWNRIRPFFPKGSP
jgi:prepilin-type N-terminal cleavage/methylation domain-containing protein